MKIGDKLVAYNGDSVILRAICGEFAWGQLCSTRIMTTYLLSDLKPYELYKIGTKVCHRAERASGGTTVGIVVGVHTFGIWILWDGKQLITYSRTSAEDILEVLQ